jgi:hypothetical protein
MNRAKNGLIDLRAGDLETESDRIFHQKLIARMRWLERMRLAAQTKALQWQLAPNTGDVLKDMGTHDVRLNLVHRAIAAANLRRTPQLYTFHERLAEPVIGSVIACDQPTGPQARRVVVLDGIDGRTHCIDIGTEEAHLFPKSIVRVSHRRTGPRRVDRTIVEIAAANGGRYDIDLHLGVIGRLQSRPPRPTSVDWKRLIAPSVPAIANRMDRGMFVPTTSIACGNTNECSRMPALS